MAGWSLDNIRPKLDVIFGAEGLRYKIQHPNALSPRVFIQHEGELPNDSREIVTSLFPDGTYVDFIPKVSFPDVVEPVAFVRKPTLNRIGRSFEDIDSTPSPMGEAVRTSPRVRTRIDT